MGKKSFLDKVTGKKAPAAVISKSVDAAVDEQQIDGEVDHLWIKEDAEVKKPKIEKHPRIDTEILRGRIADKIAKMNNN